MILHYGHLFTYRKFLYCLEDNTGIQPAYFHAHTLRTSHICPTLRVRTLIKTSITYTTIFPSFWFTLPSPYFSLPTHIYFFFGLRYAYNFKRYPCTHAQFTYAAPILNTLTDLAFKNCKDVVASGGVQVVVQIVYKNTCAHYAHTRKGFYINSHIHRLRSLERTRKKEIFTRKRIN